ncbi:uncharacterized protein LOC128361783 [Scomber japonicus]|uniref:uncharacterized protein LOC128361783 n=1 Tax=Scomber japonicus TaxID=13676 RepID=UPI0023059FDB|nr:uncharacterized protein LOC128361783 [Scomber japonicus]
MAVDLCRTGLLLSFLTLCACLEEECVLGIVGRSVSLPCIYTELLTFVNISIEWRRGSEVVLKSKWREDGNVEICSTNSLIISADAPLTGNFSLKLPTVDPKEDKTYYSLFVTSQGNHSVPLCTVCLKTAASFSSPLLLREEAQGDETVFLCHSSGGFPAPAVYWFINDTHEPPEGSVKTQASSLPHSRLYNVTSHLTANISKESSVSCIIENMYMKETLSSTSYGVRGSPVVRRASEAMWMFSTGLCVVVGVMVVAGVFYQIHLDRISKKKKKQYQHSRPGRGHRRREPDIEETEAMKSGPKETDV